MANENGRGLSIVLTAIAAIVLIGGTAIFIESYDSGPEVTATSEAVPSTPPSPETDVVPVGGVATGGGGTAAEGGRTFTLPVLAGLVALTLAALSRTVLRPRTA